jgi:hypothetical protein
MIASSNNMLEMSDKQGSGDMMKKANLFLKE